MNKELLKQFVLDNPKLVSMKPVGDGIFLLKYKKTVFYKNSWNDFLEECRGTIVDSNFDVISYPFRKIYNLGVEAKAPRFDDAEEVIAYRKVNGFMVAVTHHNNDLLVSTTGTTDSDFVGYAKEMMLKHMSWSDWQMAVGSDDARGMTFMFECVHPLDPHIIPEESGMYILGYRENKWGSRVGHDAGVLQDLAVMFNCFKPESVTTTMGAVKNLAKECRHEGFVFYHRDGRSAKIKSPYYLTSKWVARNPRTDKLVDMKNDIKKNIDEEYYGLIDAIRLNIDSYTVMNEQERLSWVRKQLA